MNQRSRSQFWLVLNRGLQNDGPLVRIVRTRQTAESFTSATASATAATLLLLFQFGLNRDSRNIVLKMFTDRIECLLCIVEAQR